VAVLANFAIIIPDNSVRILQLNLFMRRDLLALLRGDPPPDSGQAYNQMALV